MSSPVRLMITVLCLAAVLCTVDAGRKRELKNPVKYSVTTYTRNTKDAGTDASVYIKIVRTGDTTREFLLDSPGDNFQRGFFDYFTIEAEENGKLLGFKLRINWNELYLLGRSWGFSTRSVEDMSEGTQIKCKDPRWISVRSWESVACYKQE